MSSPVTTHRPSGDTEEQLLLVKTAADCKGNGDQAYHISAEAKKLLVEAGILKAEGVEENDSGFLTYANCLDHSKIGAFLENVKDYDSLSFEKREALNVCYSILVGQNETRLQKAAGYIQWGGGMLSLASFSVWQAAQTFLVSGLAGNSTGPEGQMDQTADEGVKNAAETVDEGHSLSQTLNFVSHITLGTTILGLFFLQQARPWENMLTL